MTRDEMASALNNVRGELAFPEKKSTSEQEARMGNTSGLRLCLIQIRLLNQAFA